MTNDRRHMQAALGLARRGLGAVWPNPSVGCVLVRDGRVVGRGRTADGGRPHAETQAIAQAGPAARGATAYVTLEPCDHRGQTPPCTDALVAAGVARVVVAMEDPDPRVSGRGLAKLRSRGLSVELGLEEPAARWINAGFVSRIERARPLVTLKIASSLDGRIATHAGESRWITGPAARATGHLMRADHDAIMIGSGTARADDPLLTCRLPGLERRSPLRVVVDGHLSLQLTGKLVASARDSPLWVMTRAGNDPARMAAFADCAVDVIEIDGNADGKVDLPKALQALGQRGLTRLLVEAGGHLAAALLRADIVDRVVWFRAPLLLGDDGIAAVMPLGVDQLIEAPRWVRRSMAVLGGDLMEVFQKE